MKEAGGTLQMEIINLRGNLTVNKFIQSAPTPNPTDPLTNVLPLITGSTNQYLNETQRVDLNAATINNYVSGTSFKMKAEVENDCGDKAINYITLSKASTPTVGDATITCTSSPCKVLEIMVASLTGYWYYREPGQTDLWIKVELKLSNGMQVLVTSEKWNTLNFNISLPILSSTSNDSMNVDVIISATSIHNTALSLTKSIIVNNTLSNNYRESMYSVSYNDYNDADILFLTSQMQLTLNPPDSVFYSENGCMRDTD